MLLPWEIERNITRTPARSILLVCVSALMVCGMALYLRNIQLTEDALDGLAQQLPVTVQVTNRDGSLRSDLCIHGKDVDFLLESGVRDPAYTAVSAGELSAGGGRLQIRGANTLDALDGPTPRNFTFAEGWDCSFLEGDQPVCALKESFAQKKGLRLGEQFSAELYSLDLAGGRFTSIGYHRLTLVATYRSAETWNCILPVGWLRAATDAAAASGGEPVEFFYDSFSAVLESPSELNAYKAAVEAWGFYQRSALADPDTIGDTLSIGDEMYIKTSSEMMDSLALFRVFLLPFFGLVTLIMGMVTFLALRSSRRNIAIASSLGRQKILNAAAHFCSTVIVQMVGCLTALLALTLTVGLLPRLAGVTLGAFSLCALGGTAVALLFLFRFDTLTMLTKTD